MTNALHILNGDSTHGIFKQTSISGDVVVWREMLCEGKVVKDVGSDPFWKERYSYFEKEIGVGKLEYFDKTVKELIQLQDIASYDEIVLWFEYDLFCQINLLALCTYLLKSYRKDIRYFLVCTGKEKGKGQLQTLTDYLPEEYENLYRNKIRISRNLLLFAQNAWEVYAENDINALKDFDFNQSKKFVYLQAAIDQHLLRFKDEKGLNQIDHKILSLVSSGIHSEKELIKELLCWQKEDTVYGFGDVQYENYIKKLSDFVLVENGRIKLNKKGKGIV
jgi:hypothetical protein